MTQAVHLKRPYANDEIEILLTTTEAPNPEAQFAMEMIERWGIVAAKDNGEDSSGRQKLTKLPIPELVQEACDTSQQAFEEFRKRGWMTAVPTPEEAKAKFFSEHPDDLEKKKR